MAPRIILHIGQQKTGTTALQLALVADRERLREAGVLYPDVGHLQERRSSALRPSHNGLFYGLEGQDTSRLVATPEAIHAELEREIEASAAHTVVLSAERAFQAADHQADVLARLDAIVPGPKQVVAYLRRPDHYVISFHKHDVRMGARIAGLHTPKRMARLERTSRLDHIRALGLYADRYGSVELFRYEHVPNTVSHFYEAVLELEPPAELARRANPSIPAALTDLVREHVAIHGRLARRQIRALVAFGERERVDLLGPANRARLVDFYRPHNEYLGSLMGRPVLFDDLDDAVEPDPDSISVARANERYRDVFAALLAVQDVDTLRARCLVLEQHGRHAEASQVFEAASRRLSQMEIESFRIDLEQSSKGRWSIGDEGYVEVHPAAPTEDRA